MEKRENVNEKYTPKRKEKTNQNKKIKKSTARLNVVSFNNGIFKSTNKTEEPKNIDENREEN